MAKRFSQKTILEAIRGSGGIINTVAKKLDVEWHTAKKYIFKYKSTRQAYDNEREKILDLADQGLYHLVQKKDLGAIKWLQSTKGKERGYTPKVEVEENRKTEVTIFQLPDNGRLQTDDQDE